MHLPPLCSRNPRTQRQGPSFGLPGTPKPGSWGLSGQPGGLWGLSQGPQVLGGCPNRHTPEESKI